MAVTRSLLGVAGDQMLTVPGIALQDRPLVRMVGNELQCANVNQTATDINQMLNVYLGQLVLFVGLQITVLAGAASGVDIGDGTNDDGYYDTADLTAAVGTIYCSAVTWTEGVGTLIVAAGQNNALFAIPGGKMYTANDTIDVVFDNTTADAAFKLRALVVSFFDF
jgi:hypothetical protein